MFDRKEYKTAALSQLKGRWRVPLLANLVMMIILGVILWIIRPDPHTIRTASQHTGNWNFSYHVSVDTANPNSPLSILLTCIFGAFWVSFLALLDKLYKSRSPIEFSSFIKGLDNWFQAVRGTFWFTLWVTLWSMLFLIPGIVKAYSYSMMFYIMAEYPQIGVTRAMNLSKVMTRGYKADLFFLDLSFLGWTILSGMTGGIGFLWLVPYCQMTKTNAYHTLKEYAINTSLLKPEDFTS